MIHIPAYGVLSFLWFMSFMKMEPQRKVLLVNCFVCIALVLFAISDEVHQSIVPGRIASIIDVGLDVLGIGIGFAVYVTLRSSNALSRF
jgi:VanZ family protein